jgi:hypothetical protein
MISSDSRRARFERLGRSRCGATDGGPLRPHAQSEPTSSTACPDLASLVGVRARAQTSLERAPPTDRQVGVAYSTWHDRLPWAKTWDVPELGPYLSNDVEVIAQHAAWLSDANVDFIYIDWSNNLDTGVPGKPDQPRQRFIESATRTLFDVYSRLPRHPKIALMIGFPGEIADLEDGRLKRKADQVWTEFAANPVDQNLYLPLPGPSSAVGLRRHTQPGRRGLRGLRIIQVGEPSNFVGTRHDFTREFHLFRRQSRYIWF